MRSMYWVLYRRPVYDLLSPKGLSVFLPWSRPLSVCLSVCPGLRADFEVLEGVLRGNGQVEVPAGALRPHPRSQP